MKQNDNEANTYLVVARDGDVDVSGRGVGVAQSDDRDVDVGGLSYRLVVHAWVRHYQHTGLTECSLPNNVKYYTSMIS